MKVLSDLRKSRHLSQDELAKIVGYSKSSVAMWESGMREPSNATILKLAEYFGVTSDYLLTGEKALEDHPDGSNWIPVVGEIKAGIPTDACQDILDWEEISPEMASSGQYVALRINGISMEPRFHEGDVVIVHCQSDLESGDVGIVFVDGNAATMKKVMKRPDGIMLVALNPNYEPDYYPHFFSNDEIATLPVRIYGRVVELRAKF